MYIYISKDNLQCQSWPFTLFKTDSVAHCVHVRLPISRQKQGRLEMHATTSSSTRDLNSDPRMYTANVSPTEPSLKPVMGTLD